VTPVPTEWGRVIDPDAFGAAVRRARPKVVALVHGDTSTGILQPLPDLVRIAHEHGAVVLVDAVLTVGGTELEVDRWALDVCVGGTQKCLGCPPGMAPITYTPEVERLILGPAQDLLQTRFGLGIDHRLISSVDRRGPAARIGVWPAGTQAGALPPGGHVIAKPGSVKPHTTFNAEVYVLSKEEGGRHTPFFSGYRPQFYLRTTDVTGEAKLAEGTEMIMPGDNVEMAFGQGETVVTPLQLADAYATFANGGTRYAPEVAAGRAVTLKTRAQLAALGTVAAKVNELSKAASAPATRRLRRKARLQSWLRWSQLRRWRRGAGVCSEPVEHLRGGPSRLKSQMRCP